MIQCPLFKLIQTEGDIIIGIDEAGRGPVLGPMVYSAFYTTNLDHIKTMGFNDSKVLSKTQREQLYEKIKADEYCGFCTKILSPEYISNLMCQPNKISLNEIAFSAVREIISQIMELTKKPIEKIYCDTVGPAAKYKAMIHESFPSIPLKSIEVCPKADAIYPVVSAASICAKVTRDTCLEQWIFPEGIEDHEFGCGYPMDDVSLKWMKKYYDPFFGYPCLVRFGWETSKRILESKVPLSRPFPYDQNENDYTSQQSRTLSERYLTDVTEW